MAISPQLIDKIRGQALVEISFARRYKQGKVRNWQKNENLYYGKKEYSEESRANVDLGRMQEFVHTLESKIDEPLVFKFTKRKESQLKRVERLNALRVQDQESDFWDMKDLAGKKQAIMYGRAIYFYCADSIDGYKARLENCDVYDFLIDPSAGGLFVEKAAYLGRYGVVLWKSDLKAGVKRGDYIRSEADRLIKGSGNSTEMSQEETNKQNRERAIDTVMGQKNIGNPDKFVFWEWFTTYEGTRYKLVIQESSGAVIKCEELTDVFESGLWPVWTWAAFLDLTEFWTPSYCDYVREIFMAQSVSINQMMDNAEQINKPQKAVNVSMIENLAEVKYRKNGIIKVKGEFDVNKAIQILQTPSISTPLEVFDKLEAIQEKASGVTAGAKGVADEEGKVGIYEGNQANEADRFGLLNKSYAFGYKRFALLYQWGVREHLTRRTAIQMIGPEGVSQEDVSRRDIFRKNDTFNVMVEASNAELIVSEADKRARVTFLTNESLTGNINPKKATEMKAKIVGFNEEEIRQLLDKSDFGDAELMSEADRDIESILDGKRIRPNPGATTAYLQRFVDYMMDYEDDLDEDERARMFAYMDLLGPVIMSNMVRMAQTKISEAGMGGINPQAMNPNGSPADAMPMQPGIAGINGQPQQPPETPEMPTGDLLLGKNPITNV